MPTVLPRPTTAPPARSPTALPAAAPAPAPAAARASGFQSCSRLVDPEAAGVPRPRGAHDFDEREEDQRDDAELAPGERYGDLVLVAEEPIGQGPERCGERRDRGDVGNRLPCPAGEEAQQLCDQIHA